MFGLLNVDKPGGVTSRDVVNRVQRLVKPHKVGHAGTLDPLATGVLVIGIGPATRLVEYVQRMPKTYRAGFLLGRTSDTEDVEGTVVLLPDAPQPTLDQIQAILPRFLGRIQQVPPAYSALKVAGERAYDLARRGQAVDLAPREVEILSIDLVDYEYPALELVIRCGSGTYVRSLGRDIARALQTEAVMSTLRREAIGEFRAERACRYEVVSLDSIRQGLLSPVLALGSLAQVVVNEDEVRRFSQGQAIHNRWSSLAGECAAVDQAGNLVAILTADADSLRPTKGFRDQP